MRYQRGEVGLQFAVVTSWSSHVTHCQVGNLTPRANHVLVNHYEPGQGILPHTDGPAYSPWAAILSLGSAAVFDFWRDHAHAASGMLPALSLLLPPRSLLIFSEDAYQKHLHGLADRSCDTLEGIANASLVADADGLNGGVASWRRQLQSDGSLRREERYSLTIRHVPHTPEGNGSIGSCTPTDPIATGTFEGAKAGYGEGLAAKAAANPVTAV